MKIIRANLIKRTNAGIIGCRVLCVFLIILFGGCSNRTAAFSQFDEIDSAIGRFASYLVKATRDDGMFEYRINMNPTVKVEKNYNILRHAGTIYAMAMCYERYPDNDLRSAIERAGRYLRDESIHPICDEGNILAVWSNPEVNNSGNPLQAKLGGTGLGLVALISIDEIFPDFTPISDLRALGQFIIYMQNEDGSFSSKYIPSEGGRQHGWQSLYYPGEAALGLLMLYEKDPSDIWVKSAYRMLEYLARSREKSAEAPLDHWALLATQKLFELENIKDIPLSKELLIHHAIQVCEALLQHQVDVPYWSNYNGGFSEDGRTAPTATRLEGLLAALSFIPREYEIRQRINNAIPRGISFLLHAQIKEGDFIGAMPRSVGIKWGNRPDAINFNNRANEVRIDYIQHAMSAMIQYQQLMKRQ